MRLRIGTLSRAAHTINDDSVAVAQERICLARLDDDFLARQIFANIGISIAENLGLLVIQRTVRLVIV